MDVIIKLPILNDHMRREIYLRASVPPLQSVIDDAPYTFAQHVARLDAYQAIVDWDHTPRYIKAQIEYECDRYRYLCVLKLPILCPVTEIAKRLFFVCWIS